MRENGGEKKKRWTFQKNNIITFQDTRLFVRQNITLCNTTSKYTKKNKNILTTFLQIYLIGKLSTTRQCACLSFCKFFCSNGAEIIELKKKLIFMIEIELKIKILIFFSFVNN
jgi:hypothetical protein